MSQMWILKYLWKLVLKLSKKCSEGGVDDSNGTIGSAVMATIDRMVEVALADTASRTWMQKHCHDDTGFGFEDELQAGLGS